MGNFEMTPTIEEVKRVADKHGIALANHTFQAEALQAFAQHYIEVGRKEQLEKDAKLCNLHASNYFASHNNIIQIYTELYPEEYYGGKHTFYFDKHTACVELEAAIRNNTGE